MAGSIKTEDGDVGFKIAPMVDVVFVLLLFFMASAGAQLVEKEISIKLPGYSPLGQPMQEVPIVIEIAPDGLVTMNSQVLGRGGDKDLMGLKTWLKTTTQNFGAKDPVIIRPAMDARQERIVDVLNACTAAGIVDLTFG